MSTTISNREQLFERLRSNGQERLLRFWDELTSAERQQLVRQIENVDLGQIAELYRHGVASQDWDALAKRACPAAAVRLADRRAAGPANPMEARRAGADAFRAGKVGILLVAGGQGSRLGWDHPKGLYPIGPLSNASLLQIHLEKALAAARRYGAPVPVYIMTSPVTHDEQVAFLHEHKRFGLAEDDVVLFSQGTMPAVDATNGEILLSAKDSLFLSPDGHGGMVAALASSGALDDIQRRGIEHLFYFQVDNPLAPVGTPEFVGYHVLARSEMTSMAVAKQTPQDRLGAFAEIDGRMHVIEYSDLPIAVAEQREESGGLRFWAGSIAVHVFSVPFLKRALTMKNSMPFHVAHKKVPYIDTHGKPIQPMEPNALKFEKFIFDLLPHAENPLIVEYAEQAVFAPLKNAPGDERDTPQYVQQFMVAEHGRWLEAAGTKVADRVAVEISPLWALDQEGVAGRADLPKNVDKPTYFRDGI